MSLYPAPDPTPDLPADIVDHALGLFTDAVHAVCARIDEAALPLPIRICPSYSGYDVAVQVMADDFDTWVQALDKAPLPLGPNTQLDKDGNTHVSMVASVRHWSVMLITVHPVSS